MVFVTSNIHFLIEREICVLLQIVFLPQVTRRLVLMLSAHTPGAYDVVATALGSPVTYHDAAVLQNEQAVGG